MAGMTHMQHAQPILFAFLLRTPRRSRGHHAIAARRSKRRRVSDGSARLLELIGIDRNAIARELGFSRITASSSMRQRSDFALDYLFALNASPRISLASPRFRDFASHEFRM